jgi:hypothetical protein
MSSGRIITLFPIELPDSGPLSKNNASHSIAISAAAHVLLFGLISLLLLRHVPQINNKLTAKRSSMRLLNLDKPDTSTKAPGAKALQFSPQQKTPHPDAAKSNAHAGSRTSAMQVAAVQSAPHTLLQPNLPPDVSLPIAKPAPTVTPASQTATAITHLTPAATASTLRPTPVLPNHELTPSTLNISSTMFSTAMPALPPSRTTVVLAPKAKPELAQSTTPPATKDVSLSDLHMPEAGIAAPRPSVAVITTAANSTTAGNAPGNATNSAATESGTGSATHNGGTGNTHLAANSGAAAIAGSTADSISMPENGQFGVVVVGASLDEEYPEAQGLWGGRMPYTVYVHVGLAKSWILQYSLPPAANAASTGVVTHIAAPWPYEIERPNLAPGDINADALMVHGYVNKDGRFTTLAIVSPQQFPQEKFVLDTLRKWQFRPAEENGQDTDVEVLLIIPDTLD